MGVKGKGGWYSGEYTEDIVESFQKFLGAVNLTIPGISTGNATLPIDALNSNAIQPYGYFPQFVPKVATTELQRTWYGNLKISCCSWVTIWESLWILSRYDYRFKSCNAKQRN